MSLYDLVKKIHFRLYKNNVENKVCSSSGKFNIFGKVTLENARNITIGEGTTLNEGVYISGHDKVTIGEYVSVSTGVKIITAYLDEGNINMKKCKDIHMSKPVNIGGNTHLGAGSIILPGVTIGSNCIVGAGSVVTKCFDSNSVVVGNPAKLLRYINNKNDLC
ncbi:acyltransferase [Vibrio breoganii]|uniref:acyltransferase n=1 Tax=Vibrio breoganii TaxID=553239 RepID=UPI000C82B48B|nr:acyltransferase [Vibrio breoganii]PMH15398.1 hypothetical protein BCU74_03040 [Vibrio breoganii]PMM14667.1 hypothetical protein BCT60_09650 [Vibrio breoganii]